MFTLLQNKRDFRIVRENNYTICKGIKIGKLWTIQTADVCISNIQGRKSAQLKAIRLAVLDVMMMEAVISEETMIEWSHK